MSDRVYLLLTVIFVTMLVLELVVPLRRKTWERGWIVRATLLNLLQAVPLVVAAVTVNEWFGLHPLLDAQSVLPAWLAGLAAFVLGNFIQYWWHRLQHRSDFLWRALHQLHHSPRHVDVLVSNYAHPVDFLIILSFYAFAALAVLGLDPEGVAWCTFFSGLYNYWVHCNLRSPRWLGYFVQRPEMHRVHHRIDHHAQNYGLPIWDLMFGTWHNPEDVEFECGFHGDRETQVLRMLAGRDVHG